MNSINHPHTENKDAIINENASSQHSFGSSALLEMKKQVNEFYYQCNSELSVDDKPLSDLEKQSYSDDMQCRICLCGDDELSEHEALNNPLFSICTCAGSMKLIHHNCIRKWLEGKVHKKNYKFVYSYNWKNLECELCKTRFKDTHMHEGKQYNILNYIRPESGAYLILESFTNTPHKTIHAISIDERSLKQRKSYTFLVGRENTVDIRITDISVSRGHSYINYYNGNFYVADNNSKFGTLMLVQQPIEVKFNSKFMSVMQLGRYLVSANPILPSFGCFNRQKLKQYKLPENKSYDDYIKMYPYLLSFKLGVINKNSVKNFKDAEGHEELNLKHKKKTKKNKIGHFKDILDEALTKNQ